MLGQKGCPPVWGGIERHVASLAAALVRRGHRVTVFARAPYQREGRARGLAPVPGIDVRELPAVHTKHLDALTHTLAGMLVAARGHDVLHFHGIGPGSVLALARHAAPRAARVVTVHALDWQRDKWGRWAQRLLRWGEGVAVRNAHRVIAVSDEIGAYLQQRYGMRASVIRNGVEAPDPRPAGAALAGRGLAPGEYFLFVGRLVPEKGVHLLIDAFRRAAPPWRLVIVGPAQEAGYAQTLRDCAAPNARIVFAGALEGAELAELYTHAGAFVLPSRIEGFPIALLEAVSYGLPVVASAIPAVSEALAAAGAEGTELCPADSAEAFAAGLARVAAAGAGGPRRVPGVPPELSWEHIAALTEEVYLAACAR